MQALTDLTPKSKFDSGKMIALIQALLSSHTLCFAFALALGAVGIFAFLGSCSWCRLFHFLGNFGASTGFATWHLCLSSTCLHLFSNHLCFELGSLGQELVLGQYLCHHIFPNHTIGVPAVAAMQKGHVPQPDFGPLIFYIYIPPCKSLLAARQFEKWIKHRISGRWYGLWDVVGTCIVASCSWSKSLIPRLEIQPPKHRTTNSFVYSYSYSNHISKRYLVTFKHEHS